MNLEFLDFTKKKHSDKVVGEGYYLVRDNTTQSIYDNSGLSEEETTRQLNRPIIWQTDANGNVVLEFQVHHTDVLRQSYLPEDLPDLLALYGAIHTFYQQEITDELLSKVKIGLKRDFRQMVEIARNERDNTILSLLNDNAYIVYRFSSIIKGQRRGVYYISLRAPR